MKSSFKQCRCVTIGILLAVFLSVASVPAQRLQVTVSIAPQRYFVEKIGGEYVDVNVMVPPGADPHTYEPKPRQVVGLAKARIFFALGLPFENAWLDRFRAVNPEMLIIRTDEGIDKLLSSHEEAEGDGHGHEEDRGDPHIWLSPRLVMKQADHIVRALEETDPPHAEAYRRNYTRFIGELNGLDLYLRSVFQGAEGQLRFLVFHPTWGYFARDYGLEQIPVESEGKEPKPAELVGIVDTAKRLNIKVVFVQPQFSVKSAQVIADAIGGKVVVADPLSQDWDSNLRKTAQQFRAALR